MNQGPPPPASMYGFSTPGAMSNMNPMGTNDQMSMLDGATMFDQFDGLPMTFGGSDGLSMHQHAPMQHHHPRYSTLPGSSNVQAALMQADPSKGYAPPANEDNTMAGPSILGTSGGNGLGSAQPPSGGNVLTEFTKRRNWPAKVVEELKDLLQILDAHGRIKYVSPSVLPLTGHNADDVLETFLKDWIHPDDVGTFTSELNESIATGNTLRLFYRLKKKDDSYAIVESVGHAHIASAKFAPNPDNQTPFCQAVFVMSRPYPTRNASLLDTFLEHKIENERLRRRIAELRREEEEEEASQSSWLAGQEASSELTQSEDLTSSVGTAFFNAQAADAQAMPPPERPSAINMTNLTRENLEGATLITRREHIKDKMARYETGSQFGTDSHAQQIELLTGLRYAEGERSHGITTGNASPALIKGDAGIAIPVERDPRTGEKKKKLKVAEEYVCTDCGTLESPEWRKGPGGPKTLCNACGLRWAKKEKKRSVPGGGPASGRDTASTNFSNDQ